MNEVRWSVYNWESTGASERTELLARPGVEKRPDISDRVKGIVSSVRKAGDETLAKLTLELDGVSLSSFEVHYIEKEDSLNKVSVAAKAAIERAKDQIERFHRALIPQSVRVEVATGVICGKIQRPIDRVGLYIPGGTAPLPSTVLMLGVPSALAGCPTRILCTPPRKDGSVDPHILLAAELCGIKRIFKIGGAQAIAALAFGTDSIPKVDKIFGPGNAWVTEAKMQVAADPNGASIDMPAGPSEVMVIADRTAQADFVAADLLSQAEHGPDSQVFLVSDDASLIERTMGALLQQLDGLPRREIAEQSLAHSRFIWVPNVGTALEVANTYAPEHLVLQVENAEAWLEKVYNAGSVFLGHWSPEAMGDYASGTNHVLPTYGWARSMSGVSVESFLKQITYQSLTPSALEELSETVIRLASLEGLDAHGRAVSVRVRAIQDSARGIERE